MDPSLSNFENLDKVVEDGLAEGESGMNLSSLETPSSSSPSCENIDESIGNRLAEEELGINLIRAAIDGNAEIFDVPNLSKEVFFRKTREEKNNILHIAIRYGQIRFVEAFLEKDFFINKKLQLITEGNSQKNTPLHVAAEMSNLGIVTLLDKYIEKMIIEGGHEGEDVKPWRAQNSENNTAVHVALLRNDFHVAEFLVKSDPVLARMVNKSQEAPLHLAVTYLQKMSTCEDMTRLLLEKASCVVGWRDVKGLTPLLRAASLDPSVIPKVIKLIIGACPESILMCDPSGKSFLHLLMHNKIFNVHHNNLEKGRDSNEVLKTIENLICLKEITILTNLQDQDGNTPSHIALKCENICIMKILKSISSVRLDIPNKDGNSASFIIEQLNLGNQLASIKENDYKAAIEGDIASLRGSVRKEGVNFYSLRDGNESNFLHLLMDTAKPPSDGGSINSFELFIKIALSWFPELLCQTNREGNTPLHIFAQNKNLYKTRAFPSSCLSLKLLITFGHFLIGTATDKTNKQDQWLMQNADGNTPLHEAIKANNKYLVLGILNQNKKSAWIANNHKETPLHLLAATSIGTEEFRIEEIMKIVNANIEALGLPDKDGLIPISRAVKANNLNMVVTLLRDVKKFSDFDGQKFWHLVLNHPSRDFASGLNQNNAFINMLQQKDKNGNTPLHLAMKEKCFGFVENILKTWEREQSSEGKQWLMGLLEILDNDGLTPIIGALKANNLNLAGRLCLVNPEAAKIGDSDGKTIWHILPKHPSCYGIMNDLLKTEALRELLQQKDKDGNTTLHLAIKEKLFNFVQDLLEKLERMESSGLKDLLQIIDNDGLTPIIRAVEADELNLAIRLCHVAPEGARKGDTNGKTIWHLLPNHKSYDLVILRELLNDSELSVILKEKDRDGNTSLHLAIKKNCFYFVQDLLKTSGRELSSNNQWCGPMNLFKIPNNVGETPEDLLADLPTLSCELETTLLTDRRTKGIRSSWRIPRTQLQNYMNSMNVIAALQTTITFTAAFSVPGGLNQDKGTPILIRSIAFQIFMILDVIAMCLSMMILICLLWMVATNKRESVMIQDFAVTLLLASFVATLMTFMAGVFAIIFPVKPWITITTLVLCSFLILLVHKLMVTKLLLRFKNATSNFVQMLEGSCC